MDKDGGRPLSCKEGVESRKDDRLPNKGFDCRRGRSCCSATTIITSRIAISKAFDNSFDAPTVARVETPSHDDDGRIWYVLSAFSGPLCLHLSPPDFQKCRLALFENVSNQKNIFSNLTHHFHHLLSLMKSSTDDLSNQLHCHHVSTHRQDYQSIQPHHHQQQSLPLPFQSPPYQEE